MEGDAFYAKLGCSRWHKLFSSVGLTIRFGDEKPPEKPVINRLIPGYHPVLQIHILD